MTTCTKAPCAQKQCAWRVRLWCPDDLWSIKPVWRQFGRRCMRACAHSLIVTSSWFMINKKPVCEWFSLVSCSVGNALIISLPAAQSRKEKKKKILWKKDKIIRSIKPEKRTRVTRKMLVSIHHSFHVYFAIIIKKLQRSEVFLSFVIIFKIHVFFSGWV